jgi:hypothetical protein
MNKTQFTYRFCLSPPTSRELHSYIQTLVTLCETILVPLSFVPVRRLGPCALSLPIASYVSINRKSTRLFYICDITVILKVVWARLLLIIYNLQNK